MTASGAVRDHHMLVLWLRTMEVVPFTEPGGSNDCAAFAARAVEKQTGRVIRVPGRGSAVAARRALKRMGGLEAAVTARLGPPIAPAHARRGDIAGVMDASGELVLMVVEGETLVGPGNRRTVRGAMTMAWSALGMPDG